MDNAQIQIIKNFQGLFSRYKAIPNEDDRTFSITVGSETVEVNKTRSTQTQAQSTKL